MRRGPDERVFAVPFPLLPQGHSMTFPRVTAILLVLCACTGGESRPRSVAGGGPVLPDTQTVDGVLVMRHGADAFARAPQWRVADTAEVVFDGGEDPSFDLTNVGTMAVLPGGQGIAARGGGDVALMLFAADGSPSRLLARAGSGPGELRGPTDPLVDGDSVMVLDWISSRLHWFAADSGHLAEMPRTMFSRGPCFPPVGILADDRLVVADRCFAPGEPPSGGAASTSAVIVSTLTGASPDTVLRLPGYDLVSVPGGTSLRRFGQQLHVAVWRGQIVAATGRSGYAVALHAPDGRLVGRIVVQGAARAVTAAMRDAKIAKELAWVESAGPMVRDKEAARRSVLELPTADSLPPFGSLIVGSDSLLWVVDYLVPTDSAWHATGFAHDGAIVGRVLGTADGRPVGFSSERVLLRTTDDDGVVRFEVRRIVK